MHPLTPLVSFLTSQVINFIDVSRTWVPVDGNQYQIAILTPTIIGIVVPTIAILFGTLVSMSVSTLRQRQVKQQLEAPPFLPSCTPSLSR